MDMARAVQANMRMAREVAAAGTMVDGGVAARTAKAQGVAEEAMAGVEVAGIPATASGVAMGGVAAERVVAEEAGKAFTQEAKAAARATRAAKVAAGRAAGALTGPLRRVEAADLERCTLTAMWTMG